MHGWRGGAIVLAAALLAPPAAAAEWVIAAYLGGARTADAPLALRLPDAGTDVVLAPVRFDGESFTAPVYYGYRVGWFRSRRAWLGVEAELVHLKVVADTARTVGVGGRLRGRTVTGRLPLASVVERFSITHGANLLLVNVVARRAVGGTRDPRLRIAARLGAGPTIPHPESTIDGVSREGYEWGAPAVQAAVGVEVRVFTRVRALAEYKLTRTRPRVAVAGGRADTTLLTQHLVAGVSVALGGR